MVHEIKTMILIEDGDCTYMNAKVPGTSQQARHIIRAHHLSLPWPFTPDVKRFVCFTKPFIDSLFGSVWTAFTDLGPGPDLVGTGICLFYFSSFMYFLFLVMCTRLSWPYSALQSTLNSSIISHCIMPYACVCSLSRNQGVFSHALHTTRAHCDLMEFFDSKDNWGAKHVKVGKTSKYIVIMC